MQKKWDANRRRAKELSLSLCVQTGVRRDGRDYGNTYIATSNTFPLGAGLT